MRRRIGLRGEPRVAVLRAVNFEQLPNLLEGVNQRRLFRQRLRRRLDRDVE